MGQELIPSMDQRDLVGPPVQELDLRVYLNVLRRRYLSLIIPAVVIFAGICAVTFLLLPSVFQASGKILVVSQLIPTDLAASTVGASAEERIKIIEQRLTTRNNFLEIARKFDLYPTQRSSLSPSEIVDKIREATQISQIELGDAQKNQRPRPGTQAVGFSLSFDYENPVIAARVANELIASILDQNIQARTARAAETSKFFGQQVSKLEGELAEMEKRIADFKKANEGSSPDTLNVRRERLADLQNQLTLITLGSGPKDSVEAQAQLKGLNGRLQAAQTQLKNVTEQRADVEKLLKKGYVTKTRVMELDNQIAKLQADIEQITASITVAQNKVNESGGQPEFLPKRRADLAGQIAMLEESIAKTPEVESGLAALSRDYQNLRADYQLAKSKTTLAATGEQMEEDRQAERFEVIEQADVPSEPISPDRPRIFLLGGLFASMAAGVGMLILMEVLDKSIRSSRDLERLLHIRPLMTIPYMTTAEDAKRKSRILQGWLLGVILLIMLALFFVDQFYLPLDVQLQRLLRLLSYYGLM